MVTGSQGHKVHNVATRQCTTLLLWLSRRLMEGDQVVGISYALYQVLSL